MITAIVIAVLFLIISIEAVEEDREWERAMSETRKRIANYVDRQNVVNPMATTNVPYEVVEPLLRENATQAAEIERLRGLVKRGWRHVEFSELDGSERWMHDARKALEGESDE